MSHVRPNGGKGRPRIILGLMTFGPDGDARVTDAGEFRRALDTLQLRGYNELDTARVYIGGKQEAWTREVGWKERGFTLATKVQYPKEHGMNTRDQVFESVETSLRELGTDDRGVAFSETLSALDELHKVGKFARLGLSNFTSFEVAEVATLCALNGWVRPTIDQAMYNAITRNMETELVSACRRYGLDIVVYNPIAGGLFSGNISTKDVVPAEGRFSDNNAAGVMYRNRYFKDSTFQALRIVEQAAQKHGLSKIETALRWAVHHSALRVLDGSDGIIIGVSSVQQLEDNLTNLEKGPLPEDVVAALEEAWRVNKVDSVPYWHGEVKYSYDTVKSLFGTAKA